MASEKPSKLYYTISEVVEMTSVKAHVLRYWEGEFSTLRPRKTRAGNRRYRQRDIDEVVAIRDLLYEKGFRIAGARKVRLAAHRKVSKVEETVPAQMKIRLDTMDPVARLHDVRKELKEILLLVREIGADEALKGKQPAAALRAAEGKG